MKRILYAWFDYRFIYLGLSTRYPGRLKIGIARHVGLRWRAIDRTMRGWQFPVFSLPCFNARWMEGHFHRVMRRYNRPVPGDGGSEFFTWTHPMSWLGWAYVVIAIFWAFAVSHLFLYVVLTGLWCWFAEVPFWTFQSSVFWGVVDWIHSFTWDPVVEARSKLAG